MRVAMVGPTYPHRGGIVHYTHALCEALAARPGVQVELHAYRKLFPSLLYKGKAYHGDQAFALKGVTVRRDLEYGSPASWRRAADAMRGADVVHFQTWTPFLAPSMLAVAKRAQAWGARLVATVHNVKPHERAHRVMNPLHGRLYRRMDAVVVHSPNLVAKAAAEFGLPEGRVRVVPHGVYSAFALGRWTRASARERLGIPQDAKVVLQFGIIRDYKGLDVTIEAMRHLPEDFVLVVAGEPWKDWDAYQRRIDAAGVRDRVKLHLRYVPDDEVEMFFRAADVAAYPYRSLDAQSGAALTAVGLGVPIVATDAGGLQGLPGAKVPPEDPEALAAALARVAKGDFDAGATVPRWDEAAAQTARLYSTLVAGAAPSPAGRR